MLPLGCDLNPCSLMLNHNLKGSGEGLQGHHGPLVTVVDSLKSLSNKELKD